MKQFFSVGLVNSKAEYSLRPDGNIRVENTGNYFVANGPVSRIVGSAFPVDATNARLNVSFTGSNSLERRRATTGSSIWTPTTSGRSSATRRARSGFILSRTRTVSAGVLRRAGAACCGQGRQHREPDRDAAALIRPAAMHN